MKETNCIKRPTCHSSVMATNAVHRFRHHYDAKQRETIGKITTPMELPDYQRKLSGITEITLEVCVRFYINKKLPKN